MKKARTHMVHMSREYPRLLVMTALTPRKTYIALKRVIIEIEEIQIVVLIV